MTSNYSVLNIKGKTTLAQRARKCSDEASANNVARNYSSDFHGVFAVQQDEVNVCFYVDGRRYLNIEKAWVA